MYYTSKIKSEVESYLEKVNNGEGYSGTTSKWADVIKHNTKELYAIIAHPKYSSSLDSLNELSGDWFKTED